MTSPLAGEEKSIDFGQVRDLKYRTFLYVSLQYSIVHPSFQLLILPPISYKVYMRIPTFPFIPRTFYTLGNYSVHLSQAKYKSLRPFTRGPILKSMPTIPFLSSFFSSSSSSKMSFPLQKSDDEWQAVLSKGKSVPLSVPMGFS